MILEIQIILTFLVKDKYLDIGVYKFEKKF